METTEQDTTARMAFEEIRDVLQDYYPNGFACIAVGVERADDTSTRINLIPLSVFPESFIEHKAEHVTSALAKMPLVAAEAVEWFAEKLNVDSVKLAGLLIKRTELIENEEKKR